jgi:hypothetical protein
MIITKMQSIDLKEFTARITLKVNILTYLVYFVITTNVTNNWFSIWLLQRVSTYMIHRQCCDIYLCISWLK